MSSVSVASTRSSALVRSAADSEVLRRHVLELMRLVDNRAAARRDHFAVRVLANRRVGAEQVVVDDDDVGSGGALAHLRDEALVVARAFRPKARLRGRGDV